MSDCGCDGTGEIRYVDQELPDTRRDLGNGLYAGPMTTYGTRLCRCRANLDPRPGKARWWTSAVVYEKSWASAVHSHTADVTVRAEVPVSADNHIVERRGNRYYPTMVDLDVSEQSLHSLFPDEARELAALLTAAADACDAIDEPCGDTCGHWWPCGCKGKPAPTTEIPF